MDTAPAFWKTFGPSLLGVAAFFGLNAYQGMAANVAALRAEVVALQEQRFGLVTAAEFEEAAGELDGGVRPAAESTEAAPTVPLTI